MKLQNYKAVPVFLTEDDIRVNIKMEEEEIMKEILPKIRAKKPEVLPFLSKLKFNPMSYSNITEVTGNLNHLLFEDVYTGDCNDATKTCSSNSNFKTSKDKAKR